MSEFVAVAKVGDIPPGEARTYPVGGKLVAVFRVGDDYHAINDLCPHMGASLATGWVEGNAVTCPWHAWRFCITDGLWLDNPKSKIRTDVYEVRVTGEDIEVRVPDAAQPAT